MTYLPPVLIHPTVFPKAYSKDLYMQLRMIAERYRRFYPCVDYYQLSKQVTKVDRTTVVTTTQDRANLLTGEAGTTAFDTVYREHVPSTERAVGWQQPHNEPTHTATEEEVFKLPIAVPTRFYRESKEIDIKLYGFDKIRDVVLTIPLIILDELGVTCKEGDKFIYGGETYMVSKANTGGYWKNTNVALYMGLNCVHKRQGS